MSRKRYTAESITNKLYEADVLESPGAQALFIKPGGPCTSNHSRRPISRLLPPFASLIRIARTPPDSLSLLELPGALPP